jgi:TPR repeat protein
MPRLDDAFGDLFRRCTEGDPKKRPAVRECALWIRDAVERRRIVDVDVADFRQYVEEMGRGRVSDDPLTVEDLVALAQRGSAASNYVLGEAHYRGVAVPRDLAAAGRHLRDAAAKRHIVALERVRQLADEGAIEATPQKIIAWQDEFTLLTRNKGHLNISQSAKLSCLASANLGQWSTFDAD